MNKHTHISFIVLFFISAALLSSCVMARPKDIPSYADPSPGAIKATVINYAVDGCTWMLKLEDGKLLQPVELYPQFKKDKLKVWIIYVPEKGGIGICMAGEMVTVTEIKLRE